MRPFALLSFALLFYCGGPAADVGAETPGSPPNIVLIVADDLGYGDLGCYGQQRIATPHIDRLAAEGIRFTQFYAGATVCAPSRVVLMTGRAPHRASVIGNYPTPQRIADGETTIAEALAEAGYHSGTIGKWGMGIPQPPGDPARNGFAYAYGYSDMLHAHNFYPDILIRNGEEVTQPGNVAREDIDWSSHYSRGRPIGGGVARDRVTYAIDEFDRETAAFLARNRDTSFFLYLTPNIPHANNEAGRYENNGMEVQTTLIENQRVYDYGQYADRDWPATEKGFATMITNLDNTVGMVRAQLDRLGIADNTVIFFTSDNGPHYEGGHTVEFFDSNGPYRGAKRDLYEGGLRMPFIAHWPGRIAPATSQKPFAFWDLMNTFQELAGLGPVPASEGISFAPTLLGHGGPQRQHEQFYWQFNEQGGKRSLLRGGLKLVQLHTLDRQPITEELYDLAADPGERDNALADAKYAEALDAMRAEISRLSQ